MRSAPPCEPHLLRALRHVELARSAGPYRVSMCQWDLKARIGWCSTRIGGIIAPAPYEKCKMMTTTAATTSKPTTPSVADDPRWARIVARDKTADGHLWYSVSTTGVYCRPSCHSRTANPKN